MALFGLPDDPAQQKRLVLAILPFVLVGAYWYFLHGNYTEEVDTMRTRLERLETRNAQARAREPQSRELEARLEQFERHIVRLEQLVPRSEEVSQLLDQIHRRAQQVGVEVARFTPGQTLAGPHYNKRVFEMTVVGSYHEIGRFLTEVGSLPRIITATQLRVVPNTVRPARDDGPLLEAAFRIETYVLPDNGQRAANGEAIVGA
jgi:type IV pilus assembly protein PilO